MPERYICEIHDDICEAVKKLRIDMIPGLCEEARVAGVRMEARLREYANMKYDLGRLKELKMKIKKLKATAEFIEANLDLAEIETDDDETFFERMMNDDD